MLSRASVLALALIAMAAILCAPHLHWSHRLLYNPSESAPRGWYLVKPLTRVHVGDFVLARLPQRFERFAAQRKYLPLGIPLLKHVSATGGANVCMIDGLLSLNDRVVARALAVDGAGRPLVAWSGCRILKEDEVLLLSTNTNASFDSRYFGPLQREQIVGCAIPLWIW